MKASIRIWFNLGATAGAVVSGAPSPAEPLARPASASELRIGGVATPISFIGLTLGLVGVGHGASLSAGTTVWDGKPMASGTHPTSLGDISSVTFNGKPGYLWLVSPLQINGQAPDDVPAGVVTVVVNSASGSPRSTLTVGAFGPSLSMLDNGHVAGVILTPDGSGAYGNGTYDLVGPVGVFACKKRQVKPGEYLILYGVGFGATNPAVPAGWEFSGAALTSNPVTFTIGTVTVTLTRVPVR